MPICSGRSASAGSRWIHGLSPSTSNERATAQRAPFFHLIGRSTVVSSHFIVALCPRDVSQHLRVHAHALAQVLERDALVVAVDPLQLLLLHDKGAEAVAVKPAASEHPV